MSTTARCRDCKTRFLVTAANLTARWLDGKGGRKGRWTYGQTCVRCIERSCAHLTPDTLNDGRESLLNQYAAHSLIDSLHSMVGYGLTDLDEERWRPLFDEHPRAINFDVFIEALHTAVARFDLVVHLTDDDWGTPEPEDIP